MYRSVELNVNGRLLRGCVRAPEGNGPFPTAIFYHGFTVDRIGMQRLHELFARALVDQGFACVRFDFYGLGESEGDFSEMTLGHEIEEAKANAEILGTPLETYEQTQQTQSAEDLAEKYQ